MLPTLPPSLNRPHLAPYADATFVPLELTSPSPPFFQRVGSAPLSLFLAYADQPAPERAERRFYVAQAPLNALPQALSSEFPAPRLVREAGQGDVYGTSLWMGMGGSSTPLHRDPNPNMLVQVAGNKTARLLRAREGQQVLEKVRHRLGLPGDEGGRFRGDEMMREEKTLLEHEIWAITSSLGGIEAHLEPGDGLFIPPGWWHAIQSRGEGLNLSVCTSSETCQH